MRLIDADAIAGEMRDYWHYNALWIQAKVIRNAPTIDAVPVVRCENCRWWYGETEKQRPCTKHNTYFEPDDYCSYGERREENV